MALNRITNQTLGVKRFQGKIALEEAVGSPFFDGISTTPPTPLIDGLDRLIFSQEFYEDCHHRLFDIPARLASMDQCGIAYMILSLTSPGVEGVLDVDNAVELARKTNDWMYENFVKSHPDRFGFFCCVALQKPEEAAKELERAVTKLGAKGVLVNGFSNLSVEDVNEVQYLDEPQVEPFWAMLSKLNVPIYLHPRNPPVNQQRLYRSYPSLAQAAYGFSIETAGHALRIMCSGILDRYPNLRIILGHCAEALPFIIHRVDHRMTTSLPGASGAHKKSMMEYFQQHFYATLAGIRRESTLRNTVEELGESRVMFSVDYPYESCEDAADWFDGLEMSDSSRRALGFENAQRIFKLK